MCPSAIVATIIGYVGGGVTGAFILAALSGGSTRYEKGYHDGATDAYDYGHMAGYRRAMRKCENADCASDN